MLLAVIVQHCLVALEMLDEAALSTQCIPLAVLYQKEALLERELLEHDASSGLLVDVADIDLLVDAEVLPS